MTKPATVGAAPAAPEKSPSTAPPSGYLVQVGQFEMKTAMTEPRKKIEAAGLTPVVEPGPKKKRPMTRLYAGHFPTQAAAKKEVQKLQDAGVDAFFLKEADLRYHVYAGSYADEQGAQKELHRITGLGIKLTMKQVMVAVPSYLLGAGYFPTREAAEAAAVQLEKRGMKPVILGPGEREK